MISHKASDTGSWTVRMAAKNHNPIKSKTASVNAESDQLDPIKFDGFFSTLEKRRAKLQSEIGSILWQLSPGKVMQAAMGYMRLVCLHRMEAKSPDFQGEHDELEDNNALLVPEYLQSALVSLPVPQHLKQLSEKEETEQLNRLFDDCEQLIEISRPLKMEKAASKLGVAANDDEEALQSFQLESKMYEDLRGRRYSYLEEPYLRYLVEGQDALMNEVYGIPGSKFVDGAIALMDSLIKGWQLTLNDMHRFMDEYDEVTESHPEDEQSLREEIQSTRLFERLLGYDLFDVRRVTGWPDSLISDLTLAAYGSANTDIQDFIALDPVEALPIQKKPFIEIDGTSYCFCYANLMDNLYRALYAAMKDRYSRLNPGQAASFAERWNIAQARASEEAVADLMKKLLPGAKIIQNSIHPLNGTSFNKKHYKESDIVVVFDDVLISIEVKGGAYCPTDPIDDPAGHVRSLKSLIEKAASQAQATIDYVKRCAGGACVLYGKDGSALYILRTDTIRQYFKLCVTVDDINEFATKIEKMELVQVPEQTIALSIDDLLVYEAYFTNPLVFLHFLTQRRKATRNQILQLNDEYDHLGFYIYTNCYSEHANKMAAEMDGRIRHVVPNGLRDELNDWFEGLYTGNEAPKPLPKSPERFNQIVDALATECHSPERRRVSCTLLDMGTDVRESIAASADTRISSHEKVPANSMIEIPAPSEEDVSISLFISSPISGCDWNICRRKVISALLTRGDDERAFMLCDWRDSKIDTCDVELIRAGSLTKEERANASRFDLGIRTMRKRTAEAIAGRKVGRNEPCPCGSGKKFKRCCGR